MNSFITIRVGRLPGRIAEIVLNGDRTVATALSVAGLTADGYDIRVQGRPADATTTLTEGDLILLVKKIKGNGDFVIVKAGRVPGAPLIEYALVDATVNGALTAAGIAPAVDDVIYRNEERVQAWMPLANGDTIVVKKSSLVAVFPNEGDDENYDDYEESPASLREEADTLIERANALLELANALESVEAARSRLNRQ